MLELDAADKIVKEYNNILNKTNTLFLPITLLPYSKEQIKDAIKVCLLVHNDDEKFYSSIYCQKRGIQES